MALKNGYYHLFPNKEGMVMKLKIVFSVLLVPLSLCSCSPKGNDSALGFPCPVESIRWGMSEQECLDALSLSETEIINPQLSEDQTIKSFLLPDSVEMFGYPANIQLYFYHPAYKGLDIGLIQIRLDYGETEVDQDQVLERMKLFFGDSAVVSNGRIETARKRSDLPQELLDSYFPPTPGLQNSDIPLGRAGIEKPMQQLAGRTVVSINNGDAVFAEKAIKKQKQQS